MESTLMITHFVRRRPESRHWMQLTCILRDGDGYRLGLHSKILEKTVEAATEIGSLVRLPEPIVFEENKWLWIDPAACVWYTDNSNPTAYPERVVVMRDEKILEAVDV